MTISTRLAEARRRFQKQIRVDQSGCWIRPDATRSQYGYDVSGYRTAWRLWHDPIQKGMQVEHRCGRGPKGCCNPDHLEAVTGSVNQMRAYARRTGQMHRRQLRVARTLHRVIGGGDWTLKGSKRTMM